MVTTNLQTRPSWPQITWKTIAVVLPFLLLYWADMWHHTMFFDEVNAWAISAWSPTLAKLFYYVHFEGHPWLWYFILWFPSRLTHDPVAMKWVEVLFGTANILIIGFLSPFTYKQRALILCSYFMVWEYTVMCRMYSVMLMLVLLYAVRRVRNPEGVVGGCALLGLAGNTDMTGVLLASALLTEYAFSSYFGVPKEERGAVIKRWVPGLLVYVVLIGLSVATLWPSKDISWQSSGHLGSQALNRHRIDASIGNMIAAPWWPISPQFPHRFWETNVNDARWLYLLVPIVLYVYWKTFRAQKNFLLLMGCTLGFGILFADVVYSGSPRHWGIAVISLLVGLWLTAADAASRGQPRKGWPVATYLLFGLSAAAGVCATVGSWLHPFSRAREATAWIEKNEPPNSVITGMPDVSFASLAEEMQRPVWFLECECSNTFKLFSKESEDFDVPEIPARLNRALDILGRQDILFSICCSPMEADDVERMRRAGLQAELLQSFPGSDMKSESFFIYRVRRVH